MRICAAVGTSAPFEEITFVRQNGLIYHYFRKEEVRTLLNGFETIELENVIKEKTFRRETYKRHMIKESFGSLKFQSRGFPHFPRLIPHFFCVCATYCFRYLS